MSDFQQTIDLRGKMERPKKAAASKNTIASLEKIYQDEEAPPPTDLKTISQPKIKESRQGMIKFLVFILTVLAIGAAVYFLFFRAKSAPVSSTAKNWYAVKLVDGEIFYGQVLDIKADPVALDNVYYNYDQAKEKAGSKPAQETGNLRLVKRGQETHGPVGAMNIVRAQVLFMEPLKADSKVLKAILDYEK